MRSVARAVLGKQGDVALDPVVLALSLTSGLLMLGNIVLSPLMVELTHIYGISGARIGLTVTIYNIPTVFLMFFMGTIVNRFGRKQLLLIGLTIFTISGSAIALSTNFAFSLLLRLLQGVGFALATPTITAILSDLYEGAEEATVQGVRVSGNYLISIIAPVFASSLMLISWRAPFLLFLVVVPVIAWMGFILPDQRKETPASTKAYFITMFHSIKDPIMVAANTTVLFRFLAYFGYLTYISFLGSETLGMTTMAVGMAIAAKSLFSLIGSLQNGRLTAYMHLAWVGVSGFIFVGVGLLAIGLVNASISLLIGSILFGLGDGILNANLKSLVNVLADKKVKDGAIAFSTGIGNLGKAMAPPLMAIVLNVGGVSAIFTVLGMLALISAVISFWIRLSMNRTTKI